MSEALVEAVRLFDLDVGTEWQKICCDHLKSQE
jgi:hypothetical protein